MLEERVMSLKLCFNCLKPGHSSKVCRSSRTCRTCRLHHSSLCIKAHSNSNSIKLPIQALVTQIQLSVKESRINPQLAPVALIVTLKHKHNRILTNPLLHLTKMRVKQVVAPKSIVNLQRSIPPM